VISWRKLRRVQAHVRSEWPAAIRFATHLGLTYEARLRRFGVDGADTDLYAYLPEENA